jgi:predicted nucleotidyltransferase
VVSAIDQEIVRQEIEKAVEFLSRWPGVRRVWLFGSAAKGRSLDWRSDLDFAVEGMIRMERYRAWAELDERMKIPVDLVALECVDPALRSEILRSGKLLYEA